MRVSSGICVITILFSIQNAETYSLENFDNSYSQRDASIFYIRQLLKRIKSNHDNNLQWRKRTDDTPKKCKEIKSDTYYVGELGPAMHNMTTYRDCMNLCETDSKCYAWSYQNSSQSCSFQTSVGLAQPSPGMMGGSCLGPAAKETHCTEVINGSYYKGTYGPAIRQVATYQDCMSRCDALATCFAWRHRAFDNTCWPLSTAYGLISDKQYTTGSCIIQQTGYPMLIIATKPPVITTTKPPVITTTKPPVITTTKPPVITTTKPPIIPIINPSIGTDTTPKKCQEIKSGSYYGGDYGTSIDNIATYQDCINLCETDSKCYGWLYQNSSQSCWLQTSVDLYITDASCMSGCCLGPAAKETHCTEVLSNSYYYSEDNSLPIFDVATYQDCMSKCDALATCFAWKHQASYSICYLQTTAYGLISDGRYTGGSCIKKQAPYPTISIEVFRQQALDQHNFYRAKHCTPPLILDPALNDIAQSYAEHLAVIDVMEHSGDSFNGHSMGECLSVFYDTNGLYIKGSDPVNNWYNEIKDYNWGNPDASTGVIGHFTQVIWKGSTRLGIGRALTSDNMTMYVVGNYFPGGNVPGQFAQNVLPIC
ncbi:unnamed protein product [Adineta steineri]|uniref:Apple domain-containing protein n=1 Tax=Adineta steineri TaxID=433720 RepID=A0A815IYC9_9BILA|nr:unnamed protein product [Adineta steineri]CAF1370947.1 unnamed protein product [Adineta steineri]CAF1371954.1 unnamed protein product [Adineta steineri]